MLNDVLQPKETGKDTQCLKQLLAAKDAYYCFPHAESVQPLSEIIRSGSMKWAKFQQSVMPSPRYEPAKSKDINSEEILRHLDYWPAIRTQISELVSVIFPFRDTQIQTQFSELAVGSSSSSLELPFGYMCITVDNALGAAQAIVHELAHQKLRLLGIIENEEQFVEEDEHHPIGLPSMFNNAIRVNASDAIHDLYSFTHLAQLNLYWVTGFSHKVTLEHAQQLLLKNLIRISSQYERLKSAKELTTLEARVITGLSVWLEALIPLAEDALSRTSYERYR